MKIGVLGGGQLGQMLALAGRRLGFEFRFLSPDPDAPAGRAAELVVADYDNEAALIHFADGLDVATYEFESIPAAAVWTVSEQVPVFPPVSALETSRDRASEKKFFERLGIPTAPFAQVDAPRDVKAALKRIGFPAILKTRRLGYDGKGQAVIRSPDDIAAAWIALKRAPAIVESMVKFSRELSLIAVRSRDGTTVFYPLVENHHSEGILRFSLAPAPAVPRAVQKTAEDYATLIMSDLNYAGVLAIELFELDGGLIANEMAPRVHNTGHWSIEGADTSQFENHLRAVAGMRLGSTEMDGAAGMVNIIGREPDVQRLGRMANVHVHMYGKTPAPRRKLGHITITADSMEGVRHTVSGVRRVLAGP